MTKNNDGISSDVSILDALGCPSLQEHSVNSEDQLEIMPNGINDPGTTDNNPGCAEEEAPPAVSTVGDDAKVEGLSSTSNATAISTHVDVIGKDDNSSTTKKLVLQKATESNHHEVSGIIKIYYFAMAFPLFNNQVTESKEGHNTDVRSDATIDHQKVNGLR